VVDFDNYIPKLPFLTEKDKEQIIWGIDNKINMISVGYLRDAENISHIKAFLAEHGGKRVKVIAKIETTEAIENFVSIVQDADGVIINREKVDILLKHTQTPTSKNELIRLAHIHGKPIIISA